MKRYASLLTLTAFLAFHTAARAGITGKVRGKVVAAENGEPLPGVNVFISAVWYGEEKRQIEVTMGAATDLEGEYVIINVPPGSFSVTANMIGFTRTTKTRVAVHVDRTTRVDFQLKSEVLDLGEEIVVTAEQDKVQLDVSSSQTTIHSAAIEYTPTDNRMERLLFLQPGVQSDDPVEGKFIIRGSPQSETTFMIDGLPMFDEKLNEPYMNVNLSAVKEIQILTGGFNAEYGNARSGIFNVITKEGEVSKFGGSVNYRYSPPKRKHFGPSAYGSESWEWRVFAGPDAMDSTANWIGWRKYVQGLNVNHDDDPSNDITAEDALEVWKWRHRPIRYAHRPDQDLDVSLSGPFPLKWVPGLRRLFKSTKFFASYKFEYSMLAMPHARDHYWDENMMLKITDNITPNIKLTLQGLYGELESVQRRRSATGEKDFMHGVNTAMDMGGEDHKYNIYHKPVLDRYRSMVGLTLTHTLSDRAFYRIRLNRMYTRYFVGPGARRDTSKVVKIGNYLYDEAPIGWAPYSQMDQPSMFYMSRGQTNKDRSMAETISFKGDLVYQFHKVSELKTGFEFTYNYFDEDRGYDDWHKGWHDSRTYIIHPKRLALYVQDKLEFEGLIANLGVRFDYFDPDYETVDIYTDPFADYLSNTQHRLYSGILNDTIPRIPADRQMSLSPRVGVSHPLSANSKIFFNYGHFVQLAVSEKLYTTTLDPVERDVDVLANPNLRLPKTVAMEVGIEQLLFNTLDLQVVGYYKDMRNEVSGVYYADLVRGIGYQTYRNNAYADVRGIEIRVQRNFGRWITGWMNYNYMQKWETNTTVPKYGFDTEIIPNNLNPQYGTALLFDPKPRRSQSLPYIRASIDLHTPDRWGKKIWGIYPFGGWRANLFTVYQTRGKFTFNPDALPGVQDNMQWLPYSNTDLRLAKRFSRFRFITAELYIDVTNLFNQKFLQPGSFFGDDWTKYLKSLKPEEHKKVGVYKGDHLYLPERGSYRRFLNPRRFYFGIRLWL